MTKTSVDPLKTVSLKSSRRATWIGHAACAWALLFAAEHIYWACGGSLLVGEANVRDSMNWFAHNPWSYVLSWGLLVALFAILALFPLALVWPGKRIKQRHMQVIALVAGYLGMTLMAVYSFTTQNSQMGLLCLGVCIFGLAVAFLRPRTQSIPGWLVFVGNWIFGGGMAIYGCIYIIAALFHIHTDYFLLYLVGGGINWAVEGILFVAVAWMVSRMR